MIDLSEANSVREASLAYVDGGVRKSYIVDVEYERHMHHILQYTYLHSIHLQLE